jgi:branched-chain amino acid transport system substrate-binding protein
MQRVAFLAVLLVASLALPPALAQQGPPIRIGLSAPLTGFGAPDGLSVRQAVELGVRQLNAAGGVLGRPIQLIVYDDQAAPPQGVAVAQRLIERDRVVAAVGGSYSGATRGAAPIFAQNRVPFVVGYAVHPDITRAGEYVFRVGFLGPVEGAGAAEVARIYFNAQRIAMMTMDNDFGRALAEGFRAHARKRELNIVGEVIYPLGEKDMAPHVTRVRAMNPDLIFVSGLFNEAALITRTIRQMGIRAQILGEEGFDSPKYLELAGRDAEGVVIVTNLNRDDPRPVVQTFLREYRAAYKMEADMVGASSYDALRIIADGLRRAGTTEARRLREAIAATRNFNGVTGVLSFTPARETIKPIQVQIVKDGTFRFFGVITDPEIITP